MPYFFSDAGQQRLAQLLGPRLLCVFDLDGTLTPIVDHPDEAVLAPAQRTLLEALAEVARVGVLSGRSLADLAPRLGFTPHYLIGNHGIEGVPGWEARGRNYAGLCRYWAQELRPRLAALDEPGLQLENKGCSLSVHYRHAARPAQVAGLLRELFAGLQPEPRIMEGKFVFNLLPQGAADKGRALAQLMHAVEASAAIYVGDDITDEDVFRLRRADILSVRTDPDPASHADFYLASQAELPRLLDALTDGMQVMQENRDADA